jgi:Ca2+-binding EF-hand superfamily protein
MMMRILALAAAAALVPALAPAQPAALAAGAGTAPGAARDAQDLVFFGERCPLVVRVQLFVDGEPALAAWNAFIADLFKDMDRDGDGALDRDEAARVPPPNVLFSGQFFGVQPGAGVNLATLDTDPVDGKVSPAELADYYRTYGGGLFQAQMGYSYASTVNLLTEVIYQRLDTNKDGELSRAELEAGATALLQLDTDEDEIVSAQELVSTAQSSQARPSLPVVSGGSLPAETPFFVVGPGDSLDRLARQFQIRYGNPEVRIRDRVLTRQEIGFDEATFATLDADRDGKLNADELARFAALPPDIEVTVRLGTRKANERPITVAARPDRRGPLPVKIHELNSGVVVFELDNVRVDLRSGEQPGNVVAAPRIDLKQYYQQQFRAADADNNGYLDAKEVEKTRFFAGSVKLFDTNGDGLIYEKEMLAVIDKTQAIQTRALAVRTSMMVYDQGQGIFELFDANRDGRLGIRDLRSASTNLLKLDKNGDGRITRTEIPQSYQLIFGRGPGAGGRFPQPVAVGSFGLPMPPGNPTAGPVWFRKMDRNRDGDISPREFLGTKEEFARLDADGDGLIDPKEAERADAQFKR